MPVALHYCSGSRTVLQDALCVLSCIKPASNQISRDKHSFFRAEPAGSTQHSIGKHGFHRSLPAHPLSYASYPISVRQVVAVAKTSFRPHLAVTPLTSLNGPDSLGHRGLTPPRTGTCPAYKKAPPKRGFHALYGGGCLWRRFRRWQWRTVVD